MSRGRDSSVSEGGALGAHGNELLQLVQLLQTARGLPLPSVETVMPYGDRGGYGRNVGRGSRGNGGGAPRRSAAAAPRARSRFAPKGRGSSRGHWFEGRWYPVAAGQTGESSAGSGRGRRVHQGDFFERSADPRGYYRGESDFDGGEGDEGFARRNGFRF